MMLEILRKRVARVQALDPHGELDFRCVTNPPASPESLRGLEAEFSVTIPGELSSLLTETDGLILGHYHHGAGPLDYVHFYGVDEIRQQMLWLRDNERFAGDPAGLVVGNGADTELFVTIDCADRVKKREPNEFPVYLFDFSDALDLKFGIHLAPSIDDFIDRTFDRLESAARNFTYYYDEGFERRMHPFDPGDRHVEIPHHESWRS